MVAGAQRLHFCADVCPPKRVATKAQKAVGKVIPMSDPSKQALDRVGLLLRKDGFHIRICSREDSNLHGSPHTVLSRTRLPVPPRERSERWKLSKKRKGCKAELN